MDGMMQRYNSKNAEERSIGPGARINVLPLSLDFMDEINQNGELTIFKRCSHGPAGDRERAIKLFPNSEHPHCYQQGLGL